MSQKGNKCRKVGTKLTRAKGGHGGESRGRWRECSSGDDMAWGIGESMHDYQFKTIFPLLFLKLQFCLISVGYHLKL